MSFYRSFNSAVTDFCSFFFILRMRRQLFKTFQVDFDDYVQETRYVCIEAWSIVLCLKE